MGTVAVNMEELHQPSVEEIEAARNAARQLVKLDRGRTVSFVPEQDGKGDAPEPISIPVNIFRTIITMLKEMGNGNAVAVVPVSAELTTQQAADLLNVSRPHLIKLLEQGELNFRMVGTHRKLPARDVLNYRDKTTAKRREALTQMGDIDQDLGLIDDEQVGSRD